MRIYIGSKRQAVQDVSGQVSLVYPLLVKEGKRYTYLNDRLDCADIDEVEFVKLSRILFVTMQRTLPVPARVREAAGEFLRHWHAKQDLTMDCLGFACVVAKIPRLEGVSIWESWMPATDQRIAPGDVVFLLRAEPKRFHAAVCLTPELYLSVWGAGGDLEIATLRDMRRDFDAEKVIRVLPRSV